MCSIKSIHCVYCFTKPDRFSNTRQYRIKNIWTINIYRSNLSLFGILADLYAFTHVAQVKKAAKSSEKGGHRLGPGGEQRHGGHRLGPGGEQQ